MFIDWLKFNWFQLICQGFFEAVLYNLILLQALWENSTFQKISGPEQNRMAGQYVTW